MTRKLKHIEKVEKWEIMYELQILLSMMTYEYQGHLKDIWIFR